MTVTVLIAAYEAQAFISRALQSVSDQTVGDWEVIVVDDASRDGTAAVVEQWAARDPRFKLIRLPRNAGPSAARNAALAAARGDWVAVLDADDAWRPERLEQLAPLAEAHGFDLLADNLVFYDEAAGRETGKAFSLGRALAPLSLAQLLASEHPRSAFKLGYMKPLMRRRFLTDNGLRYEEGLRLAEDFLLYAQMLARGARAAVIDEGYYVYTSQRGRESGKRSSKTKTVFDGASRLAIPGLVRAAASGGLSPRDAKAVDRHERWLREAAFRQRFDQVKRAEGLPAALALLGRSPRLGLHWVGKRLMDAAPALLRPPVRLRL